MNRTIKNTTIKAFQYPDFAALEAQIPAFAMVYTSPDTSRLCDDALGSR